ncbi:MAG: hypothetical protein E6Q88_03340 [Lysobacteraceae bacterium]|nr:MAG: hypothetical protein E6Q88_03340 [Xanthomonadaceae bacterium]
MLIARDSALRFIEGYKAILLRVLQHEALPRTRSLVDDLAAARSYAKGRPELIDEAISELQAIGQPVPSDVVTAVKSMKVDRWVYLRHTKAFAVFIDKEVENAYQVRALTTPLNVLVAEPPFSFEMGLFEYEGVFVCDGLALNPVALGKGYKAEFKAAYSAIRKAGRLHAGAGG